MQKLPKQRVVLLGMGHTNAHVARMWRMSPLERTELVCISDALIASYSGMVPGVLAGNYTRDQMNIDLVRFTKSVGGWLIRDRVLTIDPEARSIEFENRPPLSFDLLSIGIGSRPDKSVITQDLPKVLPIKPMQTLLDRMEIGVAELQNQKIPAPRIVVVGGGTGGIEIAFCIPNFLRSRGFENYEITVVHSGEKLSSGVLDSTERKIRQALQAKGVNVLDGCRAEKILPDRMELTGGRELDYDLALWATSAVAPELFQQLDFPKDEKGFLLTRPTLQALNSDAVFVVGDSGTLEQNPTPKAGLYAVRQGPILWENIRRFFDQVPLVEYRPQKNFLKLINTGDGKAIGEYKGFSFWNKWAWKLKNRIDTRFMNKYQDYNRPMSGMTPSTDEPEMRCLGCGGKIGGSLLSRVLKRLDVPQGEDVLVGLDQPDDCAVMRPSTENVVLTTDFFAAPVDDPYLAGRIGALNSLSDVFVMGADPTAALAIITLPHGREKNQEELLFQVLSGSLHELRKCGCSLVGGHTIEGPQLTVGFTIMAEPHSAGSPDGSIEFTKGNLQAGDRLILTKPIGSGAILAAHMNAECEHETMRVLCESMTLSNQQAAQIGRNHGVQAMTDVTGFGLAGHLVEMLKASQLAADLSLGEIPLFPGASDLLARGIQSTLAPANRDAEIRIEAREPQRKLPAYSALFDPQTCGGVLLGVPEKDCASVLSLLVETGHPHAREIGQVRERKTDDTLIRIC